ncbi:MbnP family copper-binding protein [Undibacterium sp.]|uniref:MbnP family copper-binding protein n=1 Tax=Undibacterium sp. TaxID=1914977 RepID=UPI0027318E85|nr:MbnP family copper-binding protein [Undibacterium sp.]MDP1977425.1 metallo-mystery pair system four-Cys motif protein [Undibacterium sp.]
MNTIQQTAISFSIIASALVLTACGGSGSSNTASAPVYPATMPVSINFELLANGTAVKCGTPISGMGSKATTADLKDARFYVSNVNLIDTNDKLVPVTLSANDWQNDQVSLISFIDGTGAACGGTALPTNTTLTGTVPGAAYKGISYEIGVPEALNHTDYATAAKPMNVAAMAWSWTSGRKFLKLELNPQGGVNVVRTNTTTNPPTTTTSNAATWNVHLGSGGCTTNATTGAYSCTNANRMQVKLANFNYSTQKISLDLNALFAGSDLTSDTAGAAGCMSGTTDSECKAIFEGLKIDLPSGKPATAGVQSIFVARNK